MCSLKQLLCQLYNKHDFKIEGATYLGEVKSPIYILTCINCGAQFLGYVPDQINE